MTTYSARRVDNLVHVEKRVGIFPERLGLRPAQAKQLALDIVAACRKPGPPPSVTISVADDENFVWNGGRKDGLEFAYELSQASMVPT